MNKDYIAIAKNTLEIEANALREGALRIDESLERAVEMMLACRGKVIITGVGKSGLIGAKIAATLASTGTPSFFLHPTEALHGDLGVVRPEDVVLAISYSGESEELSAILPHIRRFGVPVIGMTRSRHSTLGRHSDAVLDIGVILEACPLDVAPTSSTTLTLALGDALAVCLMHARDFQKEDFASFHPGGALGKRLFVKVADLMQSTDLPIIDHHVSMQEALLVLTQGRLGAVMIVDDEGCLVGVLSDGDVRRALMSETFSLHAPALMYASHSPISIDNAQMLASEALALIEAHTIQLLIITDASRHVVGALHLHTLVQKGIS